MGCAGGRGAQAQGYRGDFIGTSPIT